MIWESSYWKEDLLRNARRLRSRMSQQRWPERSFARLEQQLMLGFYSIRKLCDSGKLSDSTSGLSVPLTTYPWLGKAVTQMNWHRTSELYDLGNAGSESRDLIFICHQFVHSYVFQIWLDGSDGSIEISFCSDRDRHRCLYSMTLSNVVGVFELVGNDYPATASFTFNEKRQDFDICQS